MKKSLVVYEQENKGRVGEETSRIVVLMSDSG